MENKIANLIKPIIETLELDLELVQVIITSNNFGSKIVQILIDKKSNEAPTISDCQKVSKNIAPALEVEDIIKSAYSLEVISAKFNRPLFSIDDFKRFIGKNVKIVLNKTINDSQKLKGVIDNVIENSIIIRSKDLKIEIVAEDIKKANLYVSEEDYQSLLKKNKKLKENKI